MKGRAYILLGLVNFGAILELLVTAESLVCMETVRSVGRRLLGFKEERRGSRREEEERRGSRREEEERRGSKRSLEEERGKEALEEPVGHRMKRARRSPEVEVEGQGPSLASIPSMVDPHPHLTST